MSKIRNANKKIEEKVVGGYKKEEIVRKSQERYK
mgnify:CR=1 FL=1